MYQTTAIAALVLTFLGVAVHWGLYPLSTPRRWGGGHLVRGIVHVLSLLLIEQRASFLGALKKLAFLVAAFCFLVLALTGFWPVLVRGQHISGYLMIFHATFAPVFAVCLAVLALTWAGAHRLSASDCPWVLRLLRHTTRLSVPAQDTPWSGSLLVNKATFWLLLFLALPLILSIIVSMFHILGTDWQYITLAIHRWTGLVFVITGVVFAYSAVRIRMAHEGRYAAELYLGRPGGVLSRPVQ
jgi:cytochrome b subunit of formate dehydrogenase